jgi:hypothetical protein
MMIICAKAKESKFPKYMFPKGSQGMDVFDNSFGHDSRLMNKTHSKSFDTPIFLNARKKSQ